MHRFAVNLVLLAVAWLSSGYAGQVQAGEDRMKDTRSTIAEPVWSRVVEPPASPPDRIVIEGPVTEDGFQPSAVRFPAKGPARPFSTALVPGRDILPVLDVRAFGLEERVKHHASADGLTMRCTPGRQPAGLVLGTGRFHFPREVRWELIIGGEADGRIAMSLVEAGADAPADPMVILGSGQTSLGVPVAGWSESLHSRDLVLVCPPDAAEADIHSIIIAPEFPPEPRGEAGTWIWQPRTWIERPDAVVDLVEKARLERVYLQLHVEDGMVAEPQALSALVERLGDSDVAVHAVEGDPAMATARGRENALARAAAIARYQAGAPPGARLAGLQFDIEPYLLEDYSSDAAAVWRGWAESITRLAEEWDAPVSVVVPFWMLGEESGRTAIETARHAISQIVVMVYRTAPDEVFALSEPWLSWGAAHDSPIAIALENGPLPIELHQTYVRAETGPLILSYRDGEGRITLLSDHIRASDDRTVYALSHETQVNPARISFMNDRRQLSDVRSRLSRLFGAWPSFDGFMLHELDNPDQKVRQPVDPIGG